MQTNPKRIGIIGARCRNSDKDLEQLKEEFFKIYNDGDIIVSGGCPKGGDRFAEIIAKELGLTEQNGKLIIFRAEWDKYGKSAGYKRNGLIAEGCDILLAVVAPSRTGGTEDTIRKAKQAGKDIIMVLSMSEQSNNNKQFDIFDGFSEL
jgi:hypothetical protein